jgi:hypothetical protein
MICQILSINTDTDSRAKTEEAVRDGAALEIVQVPATTSSTLSNSLIMATSSTYGDQKTPPTQLIRLGVNAYATGNFSTGNYWHYANYAFEAAPDNGGLCFKAFVSTMYAGDSVDWDNTYSTGVAHGTLLLTNESGSYVSQWVLSNHNLGSNILSCWTKNPSADANYEVANFTIPF